MDFHTTCHDGNYHAYLLRLWRETPGTPWRASLQDTRDGRRVGFANLEALASHLAALPARPDAQKQDAPAREPATAQ